MEFFFKKKRVSWGEFKKFFVYLQCISLFKNKSYGKPKKDFR